MQQTPDPQPTMPLTVSLLAEQFAACGLAAGQAVLVHSAMSSLGWVAGGAQAVIEALQAVLTPAGTLMMPTHTSDNTNPANWQHPPVPESWWEIIRQHTPAYDPQKMPTRHMGAIPELFRSFPAVLRSDHPVGSFAAWGRDAAFVTQNHLLDSMFGEASPLARLYDLDGFILLLGVGHGNNTSLHLAEHRANIPKSWIEEGCAMLVDGERRWVSFSMLDYSDQDFTQLGAAYEQSQGIQLGKVGNADVHLMRQRPLIDWAIPWLEAHRRPA